MKYINVKSLQRLSRYYPDTCRKAAKLAAEYPVDEIALRDTTLQLNLSARQMNLDPVLPDAAKMSGCAIASVWKRWGGYEIRRQEEAIFRRYG